MKKLKELTKRDYTALNKIGVLRVLYPEATGDYKKDTETEEHIYAHIHFSAGEWINLNGEIKRLEEGGLYVGGSKNYILRKAITSEIEQYLIKEAERRGYKEGIIINSADPIGRKGVRLSGVSRFKPSSVDIRTNGEDIYNTNSIAFDTEYGGQNIYSSTFGWAKIIKEEPIQILGHLVEYKKGYINIGCQTFSNSEINSIRDTVFVSDKLMGSGEIQIKIKSNEWFYLDSKTINEIRSKLIE